MKIHTNNIENNKEREKESRKKCVINFYLFKTLLERDLTRKKKSKLTKAFELFMN